MDVFRGGKTLIYSLLAICLILLALSDAFFAYIVGYLYFFIMGLLYKKWNHLDFFICILSIIPLYLFIIFGIYGFVMQENKFPPNLLFVLYGTIVVAVVIELSKTKIFNFVERYSIVKEWNKYGYEIYLYQNYAFWITWILMERLSCILPKFVHYAISMATIIVFLSVVAPLIHRLNKYMLSKLYIL